MADVSTEIAIATTTLGSAASSITFSSIPSTYTDLRIVLVALGATATIYPHIGFNADTGTNYSQTGIRGNGSTADTSTGINANYLEWSYAVPSTTIQAFDTIDIFSYAGSTYKTCLLTASADKNGSGVVERAVGLWRSTSAITSIKLDNYATANFAAGTTATLYGIL